MVPGNIKGDHMLNPDFDPLRVLEQISDNQVILNDNQNKHAQAISQLIQRVNQQQQTIDDLVKNLDMANKANELLLQGLVNDIHKNLTGQIKND